MVQWYDPFKVMTSEQLTKKVRDELVLTGYPTEIVAASELAKRGWSVIHSPSYRDDIEGISREMDLWAYRAAKTRVNHQDARVGVYLFAECKKSEKPWVFFCTAEEHAEGRLGSVIKATRIDKLHAFSNRYSEKALISDDNLRRFHHYFSKHHLARSFYEPFKGKEKGGGAPAIYSAMMTVVKATLFYHRDAGASNWLGIYYPIVVFDGQLFEAHVISREEIDLRDAGHIQLAFSYFEPTTARSQRDMWESYHGFIIDVVTAEHLPEFLQVLEEEQVTLCELLKGSDKE